MENIIIWNVDTQTDFMQPTGSLSVPNAMETVANLKSMFGKAVEGNFPILGSADDHNEHSKEFVANGGPFDPHCVRGTPGQLNLPETFLGVGKVGIVRWDEQYDAKLLTLLFSHPQVIITKDDNDVFTSPHAKALLETVPKGATIYVQGVATEYCVACALRGLVAYNEENKMGWTVAVVSDAIKSITEEGKIDAFAEFRELGVKFVTTQQALEHMDQTILARKASLNSVAMQASRTEHPRRITH